MDEKEKLRHRIHSCLDRMGPYHVFLLAIFGIFSTIAGYSNTVSVFYTFTPSYYCGTQVSSGNIILQVIGYIQIPDLPGGSPTDRMERVRRCGIFLELYLSPSREIRFNCNGLSPGVQQSILICPVQYTLLCRRNNRSTDLRSTFGSLWQKEDPANYHHRTHSNGSLYPLSSTHAHNWSFYWAAVHAGELQSRSTNDRVHLVD